METKQRTLAKAVAWNLLGLMMMSLVGLVMTGSVALGGTIAIINAILGLSCYFVYERVWNSIRWGRHDG